ncbi:hypothetical protein [Kitasatospora sp. NPDC090091]|uniref:hypothetical protein n=1 Tax=Kitasatospora sp. NPDC090091 TaxID=3364081 RepID=UPI00382FD002
MDLIDTTALREAYRALLDAAAEVADAGDRVLAPPEGEWNADRILAHVALVTAATVGAAASIAAGANTTYDNRPAQDTWTIDRVIERAGGSAGLRERIRCQAESLCAFGGAALSGPELDTPVPTLLLSHGAVLVDAPVPLRDLVNGLAVAEIPGHTEQLLALLPQGGGRGGRAVPGRVSLPSG